MDFGSQYTKLIAKTIRELGVYSEIVSPDTSAEALRKMSPKGLILSGGPASVYAENAPSLDKGIYSLGIPILGLCYGMQLMAKDFGGVVRKSKGEYGISTIKILRKNQLFQGLDSEEAVWMSHGDTVEKLPKGFINLASSTNVAVAAMKGKGLLYGLQFHPEVAHTACGKQILKNFLYKICQVQAKELFLSEDILAKLLRKLKEELADKNCIIGVSGGVDSSTAAVLVHKAIGRRLKAIFIDTGLLRLGEGERVKAVFKKLGINIRYVEAQERFLKTLQGVTDPEEKRKRVGAEFIKVFEEEALKLEKELGRIDVLVQGTIYSDVIESAGAVGSEKIKSHHNVAGLPERMNLKIIEPLREFFKDEVRVLAEKLGIPAEIIFEQPFPGPGLAVRILGEVTAERVAILQQADKICREEIKRADLTKKIWQYFPVLLPVKSVAVMGDGRRYGYVIAIRAVESRDGMTADWFKAPYELLEKISSRIVNEVEEVSRVVYDITAKPPATIEWE